MKNRIIYFILFSFLNSFCYAQIPLLKQWDKRYGGAKNDFFSAIPIQTRDNGFVFAGTSQSGINGDKSQNNWDVTLGTYDFWVVKTDSMGHKVWDKRYGGNRTDVALAAMQTKDGGYILGGTSSSNISGDKTQADWNNNNGDYWIIKIDSLGAKQWDRRFGTFGQDYFTDIKQTEDGGYILGGYVYMGISGDKTEPSRGFSDYWIVKIDAAGNKLWDKRFGGNLYDNLFSICLTKNGGYLLGGSSTSDSSGDKSQSSWDTLMGSQDYWVVKVDSNGNKEWDKRFGGNQTSTLQSLIQTKDGGYILGGWSSSNAIGDKSEDTKDTSSIYRGDYWVVKIDSAGNKQWDRDFGGVFTEFTFGNIIQTNEGGYLFSGISNSNASGDKTENNLPGNGGQTWIVKIDSVGNKKWDKTLNSPMGRYLIQGGYVIQSSDICFLIGGDTGGGVGGDKTQPNWDTVSHTSDYWVVKYCDTSIVTNTKKLQHVSLAMQAYPNPFASELFVQLSGKPNNVSATYSLLDVSGRLVLPTIESFATGTKFNTQKLLPGIYFLHAKTSKEHIVKKFVKF